MSRKSSEKLIRAYYTALSIGDVDGLLKLLDDGVIHDSSEGARRFGKDAFREHVEAARRERQEAAHDLVVMSDAEGRRLAAEFTIMGRNLESGQEYGVSGGAFFLIDERKIMRVTEYRHDMSG
jgi:steroid delta-isomerase-like uncharacterized protein